MRFLDTGQRNSDEVAWVSGGSCAQHVAARAELIREAWGQGAARGVSFICAKTLTAVVNVAAKNERKESKTACVGLLGDVWDYIKGSPQWDSLGVFVIIASSQGFLSLLMANSHSLKILRCCYNVQDCISWLFATARVQ